MCYQGEAYMRVPLLNKIVLTVLFVLLVSGMSVAAQENTTIKVGYTLNSGTIKTPTVIGDEGYGYEYLNKIFRYIEGSYELEFVYIDCTEAEEMLASGEIDIYGPTTYTEMNGEDYLFTEVSFGENFIFLSALSENIYSYHSFDDLDGCTIAVQEGNPYEYLLDEFLEENEVEVEIVYFTDCDYSVAMEESGCDYCLCSSLNTFYELTPVVNLGVEESYYVTGLENTELMEEINEAMKEVHAQEYMYQEKLYLEYYDYSILSDSYITDEEYAVLQEKEIYYIGIEDIYGPIGYRNEEGEFQGVAVDIMEMIAEIAGIEYVFVEVTEDTTEEEMQALDFSFLSYDENGRENTTESEPFCEMPYILLDATLEEDEQIENIGILTHYGLQDMAQEGTIFERDVVEYDSLLNMQEAYNNGEIDSMIMTTSNLNLIRNGFDDLGYILTTLDMSLNLCLIFQEDYPDETVEIFNKVIKQLDSEEVQAAIIQHSTSEEEELTLATIMRRYPLALPFVILIVAFMMIVVITFASNKRKNELSKLLNYDKLTGLFSGHKFEEEVRVILKQDKVNQYAIITIDVDHFKYINDVFGYEIGNTVIQKIAHCIRRIAPQALVVARDSSDVFLVLVEKGVNEDHKFKFDKAEREKLFSELRPYIGETYKLSFSMGIYDIVDRERDINFMIDCANIARVVGKKNAYTTVHIYDDEMDRNRRALTDILGHMVKGITDHEFVIYYQPKIGLKNREIVGAEALVRWYRNGDLIPPNDFIPLFEKNGFIVRLDMYVLEEVCIFLKNHPYIPKIAVNLSGITIEKIEIDKQLIQIVDRYQVPHEKIEFEITETAFVDKFEQVVTSLEKLKATGFAIAIDDFGVGISSLSRLKDIPIDILKIDREFIWDSMENEKGLEIVRNIVNMAIGLKLETVAEGIETEKQDELLQSLGCDIGQGYHYTPPLPEKRFIQWIQDETR